MKINNYYFTYWMSKYSKEEFITLSNKVCFKVRVPEKIKKVYGTDEYLFHYFYCAYYTIALHYFGLNTTQISLMLDIALAPGTCKLFPPSEILESQKDVILDIENYIKRDLKDY